MLAEPPGLVSLVYTPHRDVALLLSQMHVPEANVRADTVPPETLPGGARPLC